MKCGDLCRCPARAVPQRLVVGQPSTRPVKGPKILWPRPFALAQPLTPIELLHGQSVLEVLRTKPLMAPAPGSDRRLSSEALRVGGHSHRSDHEQQGPVPGVRRRRPGARAGMRLRRERAHLHADDVHHVPRHRPMTSAHVKVAVPLACH
jgi:hypothetical protein